MDHEHSTNVFLDCHCMFRLLDYVTDIKYLACAEEMTHGQLDLLHGNQNENQKQKIRNACRTKKKQN